MKKLFLALLLIPTLLQAQDFRHRYFHYNQYFDAAAPFQIVATTADGADNEAIEICSGGGCDRLRGGYLRLFGNENGGTGAIDFRAGNLAGGNLNFYTGDNKQQWTIPYQAAANHEFIFGGSAVASSVATIRGARADGSDDGVLQLASGGAQGSNRGAGIELYGNEVGSYGGNAYIHTGNVGGRGIYFQTWDGTQTDTRLSIPTNTDADDVDLVFGRSITTAPIFTIRAQTADADDDGQISICSGGACANTRGAFMTLYGAENVASGGNVDFDLGTNGYKYTFGGGAAATAYYSLAGTNATITLGPSNPTANAYLIRAATSDGDDDSSLQLTGAGAIGASRGAYIIAYGNESGSGGDLSLNSGSNAAGDDIILTGRNAASVITMSPGVNSRWVFSANGDLTQDATNGGNIIMTKAATGLITGIAATPADVVTFANTPTLYNFVGATERSWVQARGIADATSANIDFAKSRATDGTADVIVAAQDSLGKLRWWGSDATGAGGLFRAAASIEAFVDGTPGAADMPGRIVFSTSADGAATPLARWTISTGAAKNMSLLAKDYVNDDLASFIGVSSQNGDGHDEGSVELNGGGASGYSRGAALNLYGNEHGNAGDAYLQAGNVSGADIIVRTVATGQSIYLGASSVAIDRGAYLKVNATTEELTIPVGSGAAGVNTVGNICVSGLILGVSTRITDAPGGGATTIDVGCTGSGNLDQFIDGTSTALNQVAAYPTNGDGTNTVGWAQKTATTMTVTTDGNVSGDDMKVRIVVYYLIGNTPSS